ncbi:aminodeoxychorismate synthase component I [Candidatus Providencia siddallii]|uniref:aminodeoxychorismate synthase n=1 Tax=Candidatus Providencia siddallii TaxID=1715285 RepID=A0ABM9NNY8_9GAMM
MSKNKIILQYQSDAAIKYFAPISNQPWSMLLYSGNANHSCNQFDIIVSDPIVTLTTYQKKTIIIENKKSYISKENPFNLIYKFINKYKIKNIIDNTIPFNGGALGIWSYDLARHTEKIPEIAKTDINFPDMAIGIYLWSLTIDHYNKIITLISHEDANLRLKWLLSKKISYKNNFKLTTKWQTNMPKKKYKQNIIRIHKYLQNGDCYQINLAQRFKAQYTGNEWQAFILLIKNNAVPFSSYICLQNNIIICFSPERFISLRNGNIQTRPIKGTLPRLKNIKEDIKQFEKLKNSQKNLAENLMIVDLLRNDIGKTAIPGSIKVTELFKVEQFPSVYHLVSTITAKLNKKYNAIDLLRTCFPGGSITGAPKIRAMEIIEELEPHKRHGYCGAIGYIDFLDNMDTNIAIRTLITYKKHIFCWSGGGIVSDSKINKEYQETLDKISLILPLLEKNLSKIN